MPGKTYDGMEVSEGNKAGLAWEKRIDSEAGSDGRKRLKDASLTYCRQDTFALMSLLEALQEYST